MSSPAPVTERQLTLAFRALAARHAARRSAAERELAWRAIEQEMHGRAFASERPRRSFGFRHVLPAVAAVVSALGVNAAIRSRVPPSPPSIVTAADTRPRPASSARERLHDAPPSAERRPAAAPRGGKEKAGRARPPSWAERVASGDFAGVVRDAERRGFDRVFRGGAEHELQALAQAAYYVGRREVALPSWGALRQRFPGGKAARSAAFFIGRSHDEQGRAGEASALLDLYLLESPDGVYAAEALGRKLLLARQGSDRARARQLAGDYLGRHPSGPYARAARGILAGR